MAAEELMCNSGGEISCPQNKQGVSHASPRSFPNAANECATGIREIGRLTADHTSIKLF